MWPTQAHERRAFKIPANYIRHFSKAAAMNSVATNLNITNWAGGTITDTILNLEEFPPEGGFI